MGNPNQVIKSDFQFLLQVKFQYARRGENPQYSYRELAMFVHREPDTVLRWINCTHPIPVDKAKEAIIFILEKNPGDTELADFFLPPGYTVVKEPPKGRTQRKEIEKDEIRLAILNGLSLKAIEEAYEDGKIEKNEYNKIKRLLVQVRRLAAELDEKIGREAQ